MPPILALENFDIPVTHIHAPVVPKNIIAEPVQIPLTPRTEAINTKAFEKPRIIGPEGKVVEDEGDTNNASNHPYSLKLKSMEIRSAQFADRATERKQKWLERHPKNDQNMEIIIEFNDEDPTKTMPDHLQSAMKEESQFEKPPIKREGSDKSADETDLVEKRGPSLAEIVVATRDFSPDWGELDDEIQSTQSL